MNIVVDWNNYDFKEILKGVNNIIDVLKILSLHESMVDFSLFTDDDELQNINVNCIMKNNDIDYLSIYDNDLNKNHEPFNLKSEIIKLGGKNNTNDQLTHDNDINNKETNDFVSKYKIVRTKILEKPTKRFTKSKRK